MWWSTLAWGSSPGKVGHTQIGCTCHGLAPAGALEVSFGPTPSRVPPGKQIAVTLEVRTTVPEWFDGGLDVASDLGTLGAGANTQLLIGEITHPGAPQGFVGGEIVWEFTWEAPPYDGLATLRAVANGVDGGGTTAGDGYAFAAPILVTVDSTCVDLDGDGADICTGDCDDDAPTVFPDAPELADGLDNDCDEAVDEDLSSYTPPPYSVAVPSRSCCRAAVAFSGDDDPSAPSGGGGADTEQADGGGGGCDATNAPPAWLTGLLAVGARRRLRKPFM